MDLNTPFTIPPTVMARLIGEETVILDLKSGVYFGLDDVGSRVWQLLEQGKSTNEVCDLLIEEYDVDREILFLDARELISELLEKHLIGH